MQPEINSLLEDLSSSHADAIRTVLCIEAAEHIILGGSLVTPDATPTSDVDLFVVTSQPGCDFASQRRCLDIESRSFSWLYDFLERLGRWQLQIGLISIPFDLSDLRFVVRTYLGRQLKFSPRVAEVITTARPQLHSLSLAYASGVFVNQYEDAVGLVLAGRLTDLLLRAGELVQRASHLALLQIRLVDPSYKFAVSQALRSSTTHLGYIINTVITHLENYQPTHQWAEAFLLGLNAIVAGGICDRQQADNLAFKNALNSDPVEWTPPLSMCLVGMPGYALLSESGARRLHVYSENFVTNVVGRWLCLFRLFLESDARSGVKSRPDGAASACPLCSRLCCKSPKTLCA